MKVFSQNMDLNVTDVRTAGNEDTGLLKLIALFCMICDHIGVILLPEYSDLRIIGRIAFPLYLWCLVVGITYTRSIWKYLLRLLVAGILSQPFFMYALNHEWWELNIFFTLIFGAIAMAGMREKKFGSQYWAPALALLLSLIINVDYHWKGVLLAILLFAARKERSTLVAVMVGFCLYWGQGTYIVTKLFGIPLRNILSWFSQGSTFFNSFLRAQTFALLALPFITLPTHSNLKLPKWFYYLSYPLHLFILGWIQYGFPAFLAIFGLSL